jgi:tetratricopeptide (TPR) repeat protein
MRRLHRRRWALRVAYLWLVLLYFNAMGDALAADPVTFRQHYVHGLSLYEQGQYQHSIREFQAAYALDAEPTILLNIGQAYRKLGQDKDALGYYELYLKLDPNPGDKLKATVEDYILQTRVRLDAGQRAAMRSAAERWLTAWHKADPLGLTSSSAVPFTAEGKTVAVDGADLRFFYRKLLAEHPPKPDRVHFYTAGQILYRLGGLPRGGGEDDMSFVWIETADDYLIVILQPAEQGWRVVGIDRVGAPGESVRLPPVGR